MRTPAPHTARAAYSRRSRDRVARALRAPVLGAAEYGPVLYPATDRRRIAAAPQGVLPPEAFRVLDRQAAEDIAPDKPRGPADGSPGAPRRQDRLAPRYGRPTARGGHHTGARSAVTGSTGRGLKSAPRTRPAGSVGAGDRAPSRPVARGFRQIRQLPPMLDRRALKRRRWGQRGSARLEARREAIELREFEGAARAALDTLARTLGPVDATRAAGLVGPEALRRVPRKAPPSPGRYYLTRSDPRRSWRALRPLAPFAR